MDDNKNIIEEIEEEDFYDPLLDEKNIEIDCEYVQNCLDVAGKIIAKYKKILK